MSLCLAVANLLRLFSSAVEFSGALHYTVRLIVRRHIVGKAPSACCCPQRGILRQRAGWLIAGVFSVRERHSGVANPVGQISSFCLAQALLFHPYVVRALFIRRQFLRTKSAMRC